MTDWSLKTLLQSLHDEIEAKLGIARGSFGHGGTKGDASEAVWLACLIHEAAAPGSFGGDLTLAAWPGRAPSSAFFTAAGSMGFSRLMDGAGVSGTAALAMLVQAGDRWRWL
ncbi:hypothetical protein AEB_P0396 [Altererythrobacter sp. B11]|uniref:hypothetical protein n=1 Tax=Altererythrobacter sp. B11 TaxID=2060312 RepID=UPI000DC70AB2|nr:hypothetical protein [Altererythrobacter sp. B11]BBC71264.1 hypothetical protein AEB_P0396 [Altererythrobacter sp. B11]